MHVVKVWNAGLIRAQMIVSSVTYRGPRVMGWGIVNLRESWGYHPWGTGLAVKIVAGDTVEVIPLTPPVPEPPPHPPIPPTIEEVIQEAIGAAYETHSDRTSEETFKECRACREVDGHTDDCIVPRMEQWLAGGEIPLKPKQKTPVGLKALKEVQKYFTHAEDCRVLGDCRICNGLQMRAMSAVSDALKRLSDPV